MSVLTWLHDHWAYISLAVFAVTSLIASHRTGPKR